MCDRDLLARWAMDRRKFGAGAALAGGAVGLSACASYGGGDTGRLAESSVSFAIGDDTMDAFFVHPADSESPAVIMWPDIAGLRDAKRAMARRLAGEGYAVLVLNPYYQSVSGEQFADFAAFVEQDGFEKVKPWRDKLTAGSVQRTARAAAAWLKEQPAVDGARGMGTQGYCMGGPFTIWSAAAVPGIRAAASFHGGGLVRDAENSPHTMLRGDANYLLAIAQDDDAESPDHKAILRRAMADAGAAGLVDVFAGDHGWTVPDSPAYDRAAAERAYALLLETYARAL